MTKVKTEVPQLNKRKDTVVPQLSDEETNYSGYDITSGNEKMLEMSKISSPTMTKVKTEVPQLKRGKIQQCPN